MLRELAPRGQRQPGAGSHIPGRAFFEVLCRACSHETSHLSSLSSRQHPRRVRSRAEDGPAVGAEERVQHGVHVLQEDLSLSREEFRGRPGRPPARPGIRSFRGKLPTARAGDKFASTPSLLFHFQFGSTIVLIFEAPKGLQYATPMGRVRVGEMLA